MRLEIFGDKDTEPTVRLRLIKLVGGNVALASVDHKGNALSYLFVIQTDGSIKLLRNGAYGLGLNQDDEGYLIVERE